MGLKFWVFRTFEAGHRLPLLTRLQDLFESLEPRCELSKDEETLRIWLPVILLIWFVLRCTVGHFAKKLHVTWQIMHFLAYTILSVESQMSLWRRSLHVINFESMSCFTNGYIDVGDGCWRSNVLLKSLLNLVARGIFDRQYEISVTNITFSHIWMLPLVTYQHAENVTTKLFCHQYNDGIVINVADFDFPKNRTRWNSKIRNFKVQRGYLVILFCISEVVYFRWLMLTRSN